MVGEYDRDAVPGAVPERDSSGQERVVDVCDVEGRDELAGFVGARGRPSCQPVSPQAERRRPYDVALVIDVVPIAEREDEDLVPEFLEASLFSAM